MASLAARDLGTHEQALAARVQLDVSRWGEAERAACTRLHRPRSLALLVNSIAVHDVDHLDEELMRLAEAIMTPADHAELRMGG